MAEPMSAETSPRSEQLKQKKGEIVTQLRKQNEALGGQAMTFLPITDGEEFVVFHDPAGDKSEWVGAYDNGAILIAEESARRLRVAVLAGMTPQDITREIYSIRRRLVGDDRSYAEWRSSLERSEESAADKIKKAKADEHYTPKLLAAVEDMPNVLGSNGFDMYKEMRKPQAEPKATPTEDSHPGTSDVSGVSGSPSFYQVDAIRTPEPRTPPYDMGKDMIDYAFYQEEPPLPTDIKGSLRSGYDGAPGEIPTPTSTPTATATPTSTEMPTPTPTPTPTSTEMPMSADKLDNSPSQTLIEKSIINKDNNLDQ